MKWDTTLVQTAKHFWSAILSFLNFLFSSIGLLSPLTLASMQSIASIAVFSLYCPQFLYAFKFLCFLFLFFGSFANQILCLTLSFCVKQELLYSSCFMAFRKEFNKRSIRCHSRLRWLILINFESSVSTHVPKSKPTF